ncbi:sigma-70 family RNA polymerase sigma factor [Streptomycetaceae bacterium NBC_01309]
MLGYAGTAEYAGVDIDVNADVHADVNTDIDVDIATDTGDVALTRSAQAGDAAALALLLERHRAGMRAVAMGVLGPGPDVDDVLQDAALVALARIADVRDPHSVGPWLRMVVRNNCRMLLRDSVPAEPFADTFAETFAGPRTGPAPRGVFADPEEVLQRHAMRDWVWEAVEALPVTLRLPLVLRHFTEGVTAYDHIAEVCGIPVGTVRSRLSQARAKLAGALAAAAEGAYSDARLRTAASWDEARDTLAEAAAGRFEKVIAARCAPDVALMKGTRRLGGHDLLVRLMNGAVAAGVRHRPVNVAAGRSLVVWEMEAVNPPDRPNHCPPAAAWIMHLAAGQVQQLRIAHRGAFADPPLQRSAAQRKPAWPVEESGVLRERAATRYRLQ